MRRLSRTLLTCAALVAAFAAFAATSAAEQAQAPKQSAGSFWVEVKRAELRDNWGRVWELLHPGQRRFIARQLFVNCMKRTRNYQPRKITASSVSNGRVTVPGVSKRKVTGKIVTLKIDYGLRAPSQTLKGTAVAVAGRWYWVSMAASRTAFVRLNFCG